MAKINYTKVEEAISQSLHKMNVERLLALADMAKGEGEKEEAKKWVQAFRNELARVRSKDEELFQNLGLAEEELQKIIQHPEELSAEDWEKIEGIGQRIAEHAKMVKKQLPPSQDDVSYIEKQRKEQKHKRYNVRDDWFPL